MVFVLNFAHVFLFRNKCLFLEMNDARLCSTYSEQERKKTVNVNSSQGSVAVKARRK